MSGTYGVLGFPYRYFDRDATASSDVTFWPGQSLQFLPGVTVGAGSHSIRFEGTAADTMRLFTRGDESVGAHITDGAIVLRNGGMIVLR